MATIFTKIINGEIPAYKIDENDKYLAFLVGIRLSFIKMRPFSYFIGLCADAVVIINKPQMSNKIFFIRMKFFW